MSAPPYMKLYVADYLGDTHHLGALEHGAYLLLLMGMWRAGGSLPAADANLSRLARCTPAEWDAIKDVILPYFTRSRGKLTHGRLTAEIAKYESTSGKRSEAGKHGAKKKASNNNAKAKAIASDSESNCRHNQNQNQNQNHIEVVAVVEAQAPSAEVDDWPKGDASALAGDLKALDRNIDPDRKQGLILTVGEISRWRSLGYSWFLDVIPAVQAHGARAGPDPVSTWKFFTPAIERNHANRTRPLEPVQPSRPHERHDAHSAKFTAKQRNLAVAATVEPARRERFIG